MDLNHFVWEKFTAGSEERWGDPREIILWHKGASCLIIPNVCVACVLIFDGKSITSAQKWFTREIESARSTKNYRGMPKIQNVWDCASLDRWHHHHKSLVTTSNFFEEFLVHIGRSEPLWTHSTLYFIWYQLTREKMKTPRATILAILAVLPTSIAFHQPAVARYNGVVSADETTQRQGWPRQFLHQFWQLDLSSNYWFSSSLLHWNSFLFRPRN